MANFRNDWQETLELANKELKEKGYEIRALYDEDDGTYDVEIFDGFDYYQYAENYYEHELGECINDAWAHANAKIKALASKKTVKANDDEHYESINVILNREKTPIAFQNKLDELMEEGAFDTEEEAIKWIETNPIELELYYEKGYGLFAVESGAVESNSDLVSPYTKAEFEYENF